MQRPEPAASPPESRRPAAAGWRAVGAVLATASLSLLGGCTLELFAPKGSIGEQERDLIVTASGLMLLVVVPVIALTLWFAWRYRASNERAAYAPDWAHSTRIEIVVWSIPCAIVALLAVIIWHTTQSLDPYKPLQASARPVRVEVVALDWKWLFIYPDYGIATVNELRIPVDTPVNFTLTADKLMNSFFIPQLGSQVYAMAGMQTQLHLVANEAGTYRGLSSGFSGEGFSDMHFDAVASSRADFDAWVRRARQGPLTLDDATYRAVAMPSIAAAPAEYAGVEPGLFDGILNQYTRGSGTAAICTTRTTKAVAQAGAGVVRTE